MQRLLSNTLKTSTNVASFRSRVPYRTFATYKDVSFGGSARNKMKRGVDRIADAVQVTLGPRGRNVAIEQSWGSPKITKDGVTVAKAIDFEDPLENMGAQLVKNVASKTNDVAGDGTTTATILSRAIFSEGAKAVEAGMNPMDLKRGIDLAVEEVVSFLKQKSRTIQSGEQIEQVATISANNDREIGRLLASAMARVGKEGAITVTEGKSLKDEVEIIEGTKFDSGYLSHYFVTDAKTNTCVYEDPVILITEQKISDIHKIIPVIEKVARAGKKLVIIAENVEGDALATLIYNRARGLHVAAVKGPGFGESRTAELQDIAALTGATVVSDETGLKLEDVELEHLGSAKKVTITKDDTLIMGGTGRKQDIEDRISLIRESLSLASSEYDKERLVKRIGKLSGGVALLKIGGASEVEVNEKKDRIVDALNATKAAVEEGIVPGGGVALLYASKSLDKLKASLKEKHFDQAQGVQIVQNALVVPVKTIANNAGVEGSVVAEKLLMQDNTDFGYNAYNGEYTDMIKAGVIDPTKVVRTALVDAASVASLMTTTEAIIFTKPTPSNGAPSMGGMPGMGGMGGMGGMPGMGF